MAWEGSTSAESGHKDNKTFPSLHLFYITKYEEFSTEKRPLY